MSGYEKLTLKAMVVVVVLVARVLMMTTGTVYPFYTTPLPNCDKRKKYGVRSSACKS